MKKLKIYTWEIYKYSFLFDNDYIRIVAKSKKQARKLLNKEIKNCHPPDAYVAQTIIEGVKSAPKVQVIKNKLIINSNI